MNKPGPKPIPIWDRLWKYTVIKDDHFLWVGAINEGGYGRIDNDLVHRLVYKLSFGFILDETIDHLCPFKNCWNIEHLEAVSLLENIRRKPPKTHCQRNHEFTPQNTYVIQGTRICRACRLESNSLLRLQKIAK